jgi:two-component system, sensor histidine kinase and response regulator
MTKILVIEDEQHIRDELVDWLQFEGYEVIGAEHGRVGLLQAQKHIPNLIICDIHMPEMDGYTVLLEIRATPQLTHIPFIFLTSSATRDSFRKGMDLGADDYITKPFTHSEILKAVHARLEKHRLSQQQAQEQLKNLENILASQQEKLTSKSRLVGMFSHDFRTQLTIINFSVGLIKHYGDNMERERRETKLTQISSAVQQLNQMIEDMMMLVAMENSQYQYTPQQVDLDGLLQEVVELFQSLYSQHYTINFQQDQPDHSPIIETDPKLVRQIITNLLSNAIKYSPPQSQVTVTLQDDGAAGVQIAITDQGIGIAAEDFPELFVPFRRGENARHIPGTGLGMTIVKQGIDLCGGSISVASQEGKGSTFTITLPHHVAT